MAEARRRSGSLREAVLQALLAAGRPMTALELREKLRQAGLSVPPPLIFRAIRQLIDGGAIRKICSARGYYPGAGQGVISLLCRQCGSVTEVACGHAFTALARHAEARYFDVKRYVLEMPGLCRQCQDAEVARDQTKDPPAGSCAGGVAPDD